MNGQVSNNNCMGKGAKRKRMSGLEKKLDELRTDISSQHGGIFPHSVLSFQHISMLSSKKPTSLDKVCYQLILLQIK
jgi:ATP-dependent DNA helicase Q1